MGHTPLTWAACSGALSTVQILLSEGAELDLPTSEGRTALMVACSRSNKHMVGTLLECCMQLAQRRAARDANAQYTSLVRVLGHEIASQARYSNAGKESEGWQYYFDELVFGTKDQDGRNAVVHARMSGGGKYNRRGGSSSPVGGTVPGGANGGGGKSHKNMITEMLQQAKSRIVERQEKLAHQRWIVEPIRCELCGNWEKRNRMEKHTMYNCPMRLVRCQYCNVSMPSKMIAPHIENECERRLLKCQQKCGKEIEARHLSAHENNFCTRRIVLCRLECGARCHFNTRTQHEVDQCPNRQVDCVDCNAHMQAKELNYHLYNTCAQRLVFCGRGCEHRGPFILNQQHEDEECLLRPLPCRYQHLDCSVIIGPPDKREVHELYLCPKRPGNSTRLIENRMFFLSFIHHCKLFFFPLYPFPPFYAVSCKFGACQHVCRAEDMPSHQANDCLYRIVECNNKCGVSIMAKDREAHERPGETGLCINRPVRCRHDWVGNRVTVHRAVSNTAPRSSFPSDNPQDTSHSKWEDGIVVGFKSVEIPAVVNKEKEKEKEDVLVDLDDYSTTSATISSKTVTKNAMKKGEGSTTKLKVRFNDKTEWINAGASYNFHSVSEGDGDHWACDWVLALSRDHHEAHECGHRMVTCTLGCEQEIAAKHKIKHETETCPYRTTLCPQGCGLQIPLKQLSDHKDEYCVKRIVECDNCEEPMKQDELFEHMRVDCMMHRVRCPNACSKHPRRINLQDHLSNKCAKRIIQCKWKCDVPIFADAKDYHENKICAKRELLCTMGGVGCGESILFFMIKDHVKKHCGRRIIQCSMKCGTSLMKMDEQSHQRNFCPKRPYKCYLGCGETVSVCDRELHENEYCMRRIRQCTLGCGKIVRADMMDKHIVRNCRRRIVGCPHGCDDIVRAEDVHAHGAMCGMRPVECGARSHACCRQLRQWTRMIPVDGRPFPALPYVPLIPKTEEEKDEKKYNEEFNPDRDGLPNGTQDLDAPAPHGNLITVDAEEILEIDAVSEKDQGMKRIPKEQRVLVMCECHRSTGLHRAAAMGDVDLVLAIVGGLSKKDINYEDPEGTTPLMRAAFHGHANIVRALVESGAVIDLETSRGRTAMMDAVIQNHPSVVWALMMLGGDYTRANKMGQIPLKMAIRYDTELTRLKTHRDEFGKTFTCMELVTDIAKLRNEYRNLLIAISTSNYTTIETIVKGGELHRPCHIHQLHAEKPVLASLVQDCKEKADHYRNEMNYCKTISTECDIRVKVLQRKLRENAENQQMIIEEEASWAFAAHERHEEVVRVLRGLSASHCSGVIKLGRHPAPIVQILLKGLCILRGVPPVVDGSGELTYIGPAHALLTNRQLLRFLRQYDPTKQATASGEVIDRLQQEIIDTHPFLHDEISRLPGHYPLLYALATWISSCLFLNRRGKTLPELSARMNDLLSVRTALDHELAPNLMQQRFLTAEFVLSTESYEKVQQTANQAQLRYDGLDRMIWVTRVLQFRESARHSALSWACARHKASDTIVQLLLDNGAAIDTTTEEEHMAATLIQLHVRQVQWMSTRGMWTPAKAYEFRMKEMSHLFTSQKLFAKMKKEQRTTRSPLAEALYAGNCRIANVLIENGATLTKKCHVMPQGSGPYSFFEVPLGTNIESTKPMGGTEEKTEAQTEATEAANTTTITTVTLTNSHAPGRIRLSLGSIGPGIEGKLSHCDVVTGPADCCIAIFDPPISFMTASRLGIQQRQGRSEFIDGNGLGWTTKTKLMSHHKSVDYAWNKITKKAEEIKSAEIERQRRLIIAEQVERTQRIGRIKMTKAVHSYDFAEALRLVDEEEIAIDVETLYGYTALGLAASEGTEGLSDEGVQVLAVEMLLDRPPGKIRPAVNREINGMTPLMWASNHGHVDVAESLITRGATVNYVSVENAPPHILPPPGAFQAEAAAAAAMVQEELTQLVRMYPAGSSEAEKALVEAAEEIAKAAQRGGGSRDKHTKKGAETEDDQEENNDVDSENENEEEDREEEEEEDSLYQHHKTPLIVATCAGHKKMVWILLQYGADQSMKDSSGRNALQWASALGHHDIMQLLAQSRANFFGEARASDGRASHAACRNGCGARVPPKLLDLHEQNECPKRIVPCPYSTKELSCGADELWYEEIQEHKVVCANRPVVCELCSQAIHLLRLEHHTLHKCPHRYVDCPYNCGKRDLKAKMKEQHCNLWCKCRPIECTNRCGETIPFNQVLSHKRVCLRRQVRCMLGCGEEMPFEEREEHQSNECQKRWVPCKWKGCEGTSADRSIIHENDECLHREIRCVCDKIILGRDYNAHLKTYCVKRIVRCRHKKCPMRFIYSDRKQHETTDCQQRWVSCMFKDIRRTTELGLDIEEIEDKGGSGGPNSDGSDGSMYKIVESLAVALNVKEQDDLDSRWFRVVGCGAKVRLSEMEYHWEHDCKSREILCGSGCGVTFCYSATDHHKKHTCTKRQVTCRLGCMQNMKAEERQHHEERLCKFRKIYCSFGCNEIFYEYKRKKHETEDCRLRFTDCTNKCGATMRFEDMKYHLSHQCEYRDYIPPVENFTCKRCAMENEKEKMLSEYGDDPFQWKCSVCKLAPFHKGMTVSISKKKSRGKVSGNLFG